MKKCSYFFLANNDQWIFSQSFFTMISTGMCHVNPLSCWTRIGTAFENSVDPDQMASKGGSHLIWIYTVFHSVCEFTWSNNTELSDWLTVRNGCGKLISFSRTGLNNRKSPNLRCHQSEGREYTFNTHNHYEKEFIIMKRIRSSFGKAI